MRASDPAKTTAVLDTLSWEAGVLVRRLEARQTPGEDEAPGPPAGQRGRGALRSGSVPRLGARTVGNRDAEGYFLCPERFYSLTLASAA